MPRGRCVLEPCQALEYFSRRPNPLWGAERLDDRGSTNPRRTPMNQRLIRYRTRPDAANENAALAAAVFSELRTLQPEGVRYCCLRLDDDTFIHIVETATDDGTSTLPKLAAFQAFQSGVRDRCAEPPLVRSATIVGNYRMLAEA